MQDYYLIYWNGDDVQRVEHEMDTHRAQAEGVMVVHVQEAEMVTGKTIVTTRVETYL
ncbi:MAG: hypothetical protein IKE69_12505 [Thermoguttaceae bacterium]|nr:hypothetical protein [Thermoguttaceae bacterium]